jgi:hypothetical protein
VRLQAEEKPGEGREIVAAKLRREIEKEVPLFSFAKACT